MAHRPDGNLGQLESSKRCSCVPMSQAADGVLLLLQGAHGKWCRMVAQRQTRQAPAVPRTVGGATATPTAYQTAPIAATARFQTRGCVACLQAKSHEASRWSSRLSTASSLLCSVLSSSQHGLPRPSLYSPPSPASHGSGFSFALLARYSVRARSLPSVSG